MASSNDDTDPKVLTVLLAEDDPFMRELLGAALQACGILVVNAMSGDHAVPILKTGGIDVLVTDISMPGKLDGWSLAERALVILPDIAVVYISSGPENAARRIARSLFLRKPFHPDAIVDAVRRITSRREGESPGEV